LLLYALANAPDMVSANACVPAPEANATKLQAKINEPLSTRNFRTPQGCQNRTGSNKYTG